MGKVIMMQVNGSHGSYQRSVYSVFYVGKEFINNTKKDINRI